jgi:hypothetical protein
MSIRQEAYQLCKEVWKSSIREETKELILKLNASPNFSTDFILEKDRSSFGYAARQLKAQLLGYLVVHRDRSLLLDDFPPLRWTDTFESDEQVFIEAVHKEFIRLNKACVASITENIPFQIVDPYFKFKYEISGDSIDVELLDGKTIDAMASSFSNHPGCSIAARTYVLLKEELTTENLAKNVWDFEQAILASGPLHSPEKLSRLMATHIRDSKKGLVFQLLASLTCVRASLGILNELIYQAIQSRKLPVLDENNVVNMGSLTGHAVSNGLSLICQPDDYNVNLGMMDRSLVLIRDSVSDYPIDLCRIEMMNYQSSPELGDIVELGLREIDENLNPFSRLMQYVDQIQ